MSDLTEFVPYKSSGYGAVELKMVYQKFVSQSLVFATLVNFGGIGGYYGVGILLEEDEPIRTVRIMKYSDLVAPPSLQNQQAAPQVAVSAPAVKPNIGIPVPVPDAEVSPEQTIATQTELSAVAAPSASEGASGAGTVEEIKIEDDAPPPDFVPFEKEPTAIRQVKPAYPEIALRAGIEGTVYVKMWVDKEGKVRKVIILKSDAEIFNQPSIDAGMQFVFTPAIMQKGPVAVWVAFPFRFKLRDK
jgi:protein TonB